MSEVDDSAAKTQLRLALAMRGGVSLAVWIGGAATEIRSLTEATEGFWCDVLGWSPYEDVIVDVLAGASAGGLNGVLYAGSVQYGYPLDAVRSIWLEVGGLDSLIRPDGTTAPSLLDGDASFLKVVREKLAVLVSNVDPRPTAPRQRLDLQLTATLVEPIIRPVRSPLDEQLWDQRSSARFHFSHGNELTGSDFPDPDQAGVEFDATLWRMALAARATSSFPVAFEAAVVRSTRAERFGEQPGASTPGPLVDMRGVFSERQHPDGSLGTDPARSDFVVADGGILDNIPLGRAIRAMSAMPADRPTTRYLVYLHPGVPARLAGAGTMAGDPAADWRRSSVSVLRGAIKARFESETINDDIAELELHNELVNRSRVLRRGTFARIKNRDELMVAAAAARPTYRLQRSVDDAVDLRRLLDDPVGVLGEDEFPATVAGQSIDADRWRSPLAGWNVSDRELLEGRLTDYLEKRLAAAVADDESSTSGESDNPVPGEIDIEDVLRAGVGPIRRITQLMLEWVRFLEDRGVEQANAAKPKLYLLLSVIDAALWRPRLLAWVAGAARVEAGDSSWVAETAATANRLLTIPPERAAILGTAVNDGAVGPLQEHTQQVLADLDAVFGNNAPPVGQDVRMVLANNVLLPIARELRAASRVAIGKKADEDRLDDSRTPGAEHLHAALCDGDTIELSTLVALEIVCFPEFVGGTPSQRRIDFVRMSAANRTPVARWFGELDARATDQQLRWREDAPVAAGPLPVTEDQGLHLDVKLAGNELMNFAAFLRPEWRANDWMWGRLDAVPTLVDLLLTPSVLARRLHDPADVDPVLADLEALVTSAHVGDAELDAAWATWLRTDLWEPSSGAVYDELKALADKQPDARITAIRNVVIARRQWEILAEELAQGHAPEMATAPPMRPDAAVDMVAEYHVGAQTITRPATRSTVETARDISRVAAKAIEDNARAYEARLTRATATGGQVQTTVPPKDSALVKNAQRAGKVIAFAGPVAASWFLGTPDDRRRLVPRSALLLAPVIALGLLLWAVLDSWLAVVLTFASLAVFVGSIFLVIRRLASRA